ncbi:hypothetical protein GJ496_002116 [Pomphorhynchus laevis]|nr:hypothetical protein GJ496_002116 [Pomphorhynchus laevis]
MFFVKPDWLSNKNLQSKDTEMKNHVFSNDDVSIHNTVPLKNKPEVSIIKRDFLPRRQGVVRLDGKNGKIVNTSNIVNPINKDSRKQSNKNENNVQKSAVAIQLNVENKPTDKVVRRDFLRRGQGIARFNGKNGQQVNYADINYSTNHLSGRHQNEKRNDGRKSNSNSINSESKRTDKHFNENRNDISKSNSISSNSELDEYEMKQTLSAIENAIKDTYLTCSTKCNYPNSNENVNSKMNDTGRIDPSTTNDNNTSVNSDHSFKANIHVENKQDDCVPSDKIQTMDNKPTDKVVRRDFLRRGQGIARFNGKNGQQVNYADINYSTNHLSGRHQNEKRNDGRKSNSNSINSESKHSNENRIDISKSNSISSNSELDEYDIELTLSAIEKAIKEAHLRSSNNKCDSLNNNDQVNLNDFNENATSIIDDCDSNSINSIPMLQHDIHFETDKEFTQSESNIAEDCGPTNKSHIEEYSSLANTIETDHSISVASIPAVTSEEQRQASNALKKVRNKMSLLTDAMSDLKQERKELHSRLVELENSASELEKHKAEFATRKAGDIRKIRELIHKEEILIKKKEQAAVNVRKSELDRLNAQNAEIYQKERNILIDEHKSKERKWKAAKYALQVKIKTLENDGEQIKARIRFLEDERRRKINCEESDPQRLNTAVNRVQCNTTDNNICATISSTLNVISKRISDKVIDIRLTDGTRTIIDCTTGFAFTETADGNRVIFYPDGRQECRCDRFTRRIYANGQSKIIYTGKGRDG